MNQRTEKQVHFDSAEVRFAQDDSSVGELSSEDA